MHHKFVVIDFDKPTARVYLGSYNFSSPADLKNGENPLLIRDRRIAVSYMIEAVRIFDHYHFRVVQQEAKDAKKKLQLAMPPRSPGEKPWWEDDYTNARKIVGQLPLAILHVGKAKGGQVGQVSLVWVGHLDRLRRSCQDVNEFVREARCFMFSIVRWHGPDPFRFPACVYRPAKAIKRRAEQYWSWPFSLLPFSARQKAHRCRSLCLRVSLPSPLSSASLPVPPISLSLPLSESSPMRRAGYPS